MLQPLVWENDKIIFLDQRKLPHNEELFIAKTVEETAFAIKNMVVRGAPAIGIAAVFGWVLGKNQKIEDKKIYNILKNTRPTAKDLFTALDYMINNKGNAYEKAMNYLKNLIKSEEKLVQNISEIIPNNSKILTHCHSGALAVYNWGSAFGGIAYSKVIEKKNIFLWIKETRPRFQGSITAWEAEKREIPHKIIIDSAAAYLMSKGEVDLIIVGADRISENGDIANKIGTLDIAILAKYFNIPFYIAAPFTTVDLSISNGKDIIIEKRDINEIKNYKDKLIYSENEFNFFNPAFDVVPNSLITDIITENGFYNK